MPFADKDGAGNDFVTKFRRVMVPDLKLKVPTSDGKREIVEVEAVAQCRYREVGGKRCRNSRRP